jgi:hypothetical protein
MELFCPVCHHASGNAIVADWPEPLERTIYLPLTCGECGIEFCFTVERSGMRTMAQRESFLLEELLNRRRKASHA